MRAQNKLSKKDITPILGCLFAAAVIIWMMITLIACNDAGLEPNTNEVTEISINPPMSDAAVPENLVLSFLISSPDGSQVYSSPVFTYSSSAFPYENFYGVYSLPQPYSILIRARWSAIGKNKSFTVKLFGKPLIEGDCSEPGNEMYLQETGTTSYLEFMINTY